MAISQEDEFEQLWRERTAETEDEVIALAVSFSICQMLLGLILWKCSPNVKTIISVSGENIVESTISQLGAGH